MNSKWKHLLAGLLFFLLSTPFAFSEGATRTLVTVIVASNQGSGFDLDNDAYRDELIKLFSYPSYRQIKAYALNLEKGKETTLQLPEGYVLTLTLIREEGEKALVQASIRGNGKEYLNTVLSILKPGTVFLGGPPVQEGVLILALEAGY